MLLPREENEKDGFLFGRIWPVLLCWVAVFGVLGDSYCRSQAHWTHYVGKIVDLGGEFSTSLMEEQLNHRTIEWLGLEGTLKIT